LVDFVFEPVHAGKLSIGQIQVEMHLGMGAGPTPLKTFQGIIQSAERAGFRTFHKERNHSPQSQGYLVCNTFCTARAFPAVAASITDYHRLALVMQQQGFVMRHVLSAIMHLAATQAQIQARTRGHNPVSPSFCCIDLLCGTMCTLLLVLRKWLPQTNAPLR
jgi:hypothetical protein